MGVGRIRVLGGTVWQWDSGRRVAAEGAETAGFAREGDADALTSPVGEDGTCEIPNQLLTEEGRVLCWAGAGSRTIGSIVIPVAGRAKPTDYVFEQTEVETVAGVKAWVEERIAEIGQTGGIKLGHGLALVDGAVTVDCAQSVEQDNTLPVTSAAVRTEVGNIEALLATV